ncbi:MAG TPA: thiamine pyrophosphate-dependent enzyme [Methanotrichaceae archaeon]|nr:thiamine pyrophosphate-dependent enzyme [Methanotrichaceae archaeon]HQF15945.1 thiamine pyrophosphate-dependent enzyme [Methanotrichaceae archaeon]HQI90707.1 thiamine pyrophosphate-dependent enzyme [Methanotrichaceae archaeon]HQJ28014.1 thiamine pyrophosphate-dependent enzyme [Methanotrichaceae archaeon]
MPIGPEDALKLALDMAGVVERAYVPGYPVTSLAMAAGSKMAVNEKTALERCLGASASGRRALVVVKQLGMNVLSDPLAISATHTIGAGLVVLAGDDLGPRGSQLEMDSRNYGPVTGLPVLDPADPADLYCAVLEAYSISEEIMAPAIIRASSRLLGAVSPGLQPREGSPFSTSEAWRSLSAGGRRFDRSIWDLTARGRHQRFRQRAHPAMQRASSAAVSEMPERSSGSLGIIASGPPSIEAAALGLPVLTTAYANPIPWPAVLDFLSRYQTVMVAEEPGPFLESHLLASGKVIGRLSGHLPYGWVEKDDLKAALKILSNEKPLIESQPQRASDRYKKTICDSCPFRPLLEALSRIEVLVAGDAGCVIQANRPPLPAVDLVYGLGSSIGVASGLKTKGLAVIGDFALAHSGICGLIDALWQKRDLVVVVIQNRVAAMTGGQETPDLTSVLLTLVPDLIYIDMPRSAEQLESLIRGELARPGTSVLLVRGTCPAPRTAE